MSATAQLGRHLCFCTLAGVENVRLDGECVVGRWKGSLMQIYGRDNGALLQDFLNCPTKPESIVLFTKRFGPLEVQGKPGADFRFPLSDWRRRQGEMRSAWRNQRKATGDWEMSPKDGNLAYEGRKLVYKARTLFLFLCIDLVTRPVHQMKICRYPDCPTPFFAARHLGQRFCCTTCSAWGQLMAKRKSWAKNGRRWRRNSAKAKASKGRRATLSRVKVPRIGRLRREGFL